MNAHISSQACSKKPWSLVRGKHGRALHRDQSGNEVIQTVLLLAVAALLLMGVRQLAAVMFGERGLAGAVAMVTGDPSSPGIGNPGSNEEDSLLNPEQPNNTSTTKPKVDIRHPVTLFPQPTDMTCWSAAATMLFGNQTIGPGDASLSDEGGLLADYENVKKFADSHGLEMHAPQSWSVDGLADLLKSQGPLWVAGNVPSGHAFVIAGMEGDGTPEGTRLIIYDPWPPNKGAVRSEVYADWMQKYPEATTYILHR
jgi:hypothetical protein